MKILTAVLIGAVKRAFTKSNGAIIPTTSVDGVWDLEATLAWFLRGILVIFLLWIAKNANIDPTVLQTFM